MKKMLAKRLQMVRFECPSVRNPRVSLTFGGFHFPNIQPLPLPSLLSLGVIRKGSPSMKGKEVRIFWSKISSTGCKGSSLNDPGTETPVSHSLLEESLFSFPAPLSGVIDNWTPQYESQ